MPRNRGFVKIHSTLAPNAYFAHLINILDIRNILNLFWHPEHLPTS